MVGKSKLIADKPFHALPAEEVIASWKTDVNHGLSTQEVEKRLQKHGMNVIEQKRKMNPLLIFLNQLKGPFVILLLIAAVLSFWFEEWLDGIAILVVVLINTVIGFFMEYRAGRSMESLKRLTRLNARILRNGSLTEIGSEGIVPGDILIAEAGDIILADARIFEATQLETDESTLTGESLSAAKKNEITDANAPLAERVNMLYKGTFVTKGNVRAVVVATGMQTELGQIAEMVQSAEQTNTPLEKKITQFSRRILFLTTFLIAILFITGLIKGNDLVSLMRTSIALAVAAIPEGLPIVTTLALAQGMLRMSRQNVIVKKLADVETLGGTNIICTDKTGTLTENKIEVSNVLVHNGHVKLRQNLEQRTIEVAEGDAGIRNSPAYELVLRIATLCNTAVFEFENNTVRESGDPLETGLLKLVYCEGVDAEKIRKAFPKIGEEPFTSETRTMATQHKNNDLFFTAVKGASEELVKRCQLIFDGQRTVEFTNEQKGSWTTRANELAGEGMKVIGVAFKESNSQDNQLLDNLCFVGLLGLLDPPRADVFRALEECKSAGIKVVMMTGDHPATAQNIALQLRLIARKDEEAIHGGKMQDYAQIDAREKVRWLNAHVFARVSPKQKLDLVTLYQQEGHVVGMTGDGVNDAPALKKADIGIAMGQRGTQVAQDAADVVLKDDSFSAIVLAIKSGRIIFENIRKFIMYLLSCNLSELFIILMTSFLDLHYALIPLQILYINLITDVLPALALGVTRGSKDIMKRPPRNPNEPIIDRSRWVSIIVYALIIASCSIGAVLFAHYFIHQGEKWNVQLCNNTLFITLILSQLWNVLNMTNDTKTSFFRTDVFNNKYVWFAIIGCVTITFSLYFIAPVASVLALYVPSGSDLLVMFGFSLLSMMIIRTLKRMQIIS